MIPGASSIDQVTPVTGLEEPPPRRRLRIDVLAVAGFLVCAASVAALCTGLWHLVHTGTCASGGPYVSARPCPDGTGTWIAVLPISILAWFAGMAMMRRLIIPWALLFTGIGATMLVAVLQGGLPAGGDGAAWTIGPMFLLMGLVPAVWSFATWLGERGDPPAPAGGYFPPLAGAWLGDGSTSRPGPG